MHRRFKAALLGARAGNAQVRINLDARLAQRIDVTLVPVTTRRCLVGAADHGDGAVAEADEVVGGERNAVAVVATIGRHIDAVHRTGHQNGGHAVFFGQRHILDRRADGRRHDDAIRTELQQRFDEGALFFHRIIMVGQDEGLAAAVQLAFDGFQDFAIEGVHHIMEHHADNAGARGAQAGGAAVVDITQRPRLFLDLVTRIGSNQRAVAQCQRNGGGRKTKALGNRRQFNLLCHGIPPQTHVSDGRPCLNRN